MTSTGQDAETVPQIVAQLRQDPILVQQVLGNGRTTQIADQLTALAGDVGQPVWVALVQDPDGLSNDNPTDDLLRQIHQVLGEPGIYVVATPHGVQSVETYDSPIDGVDLSLARYDTIDQAREQLGDSGRLSSAGQAALTLKLATDPDLELSDQQVQQVTGDPTWLAVTASEPSDYDHVGEPLTPLVVAVATGLVATALAWRVLRSWDAHRRTPRSQPAPGSRTPGIEEVRRDARAQLKRLDRRLATASPGLATLDAAQGSRDVAADLIESPDPLDVVGALVLATIGHAATRADGTTYRPCFFNPLHGAGDHQVPSGPGGPAVPACRRCASDIEDGTAPDALTVTRLGRDRPYYEGSTVWARTGFGSIADDLWLEVRRVGRRVGRQVGRG